MVSTHSYDIENNRETRSKTKYFDSVQEKQLYTRTVHRAASFFKFNAIRVGKNTSNYVHYSG
jgi:hypothetical protein